MRKIRSVPGLVLSGDLKVRVDTHMLAERAGRHTAVRCSGAPAGARCATWHEHRRLPSRLKRARPPLRAMAHGFTAATYR